MPVADVYDIDKKKVSQIELNDAVFAAEANPDVMYEVVRMQMASKRRGTASTKERGDIRGGGKKPWRQKGTGRARVGTTRSPYGGVVELSSVPHPEDTHTSYPRKSKRWPWYLPSA